MSPYLCAPYMDKIAKRRKYGSSASNSEMRRNDIIRLKWLFFVFSSIISSKRVFRSIFFFSPVRIVSIRWIRERMHNIYHTKRTHAYTLINPNSWTSKSSEKIRKTADGMRFDSMKSSSTWLTDRKSVKYPWVTAFLRREKNSRIIVS